MELRDSKRERETEEKEDILTTFLQLSQDNVPTDNLDPLALSIVQDLGSMATTVSKAREDPLVKQYITGGMGN